MYDLKSEKLAWECHGCTRARDHVCWAIKYPIAMWRECESCFSYTVDPHWYEKYNAAVKEYKSRMGLPDDFANMKDLRVCLGLTQADIAGRIGVRPAAYGSWERGTNKPEKDNYIKLNKVFKELRKVANV